MSRSALQVFALHCTLLYAGAAAAAPGIALEDEPSRTELAHYAMFKEAERAIPRDFKFPEHAITNRVFGIDVSHYQGKLDWKKIHGTGVRFVYAKATQGKQYFDREFAGNWTALGTLAQHDAPVLRGAYHFMSAVDAPEEQAANYLAKVGALTERDLAPCLDVEWDFLIKNRKVVKDSKGKNIDQWHAHDAKEIVRRIKTWLAIVEKSTGKKPLIYTNASWWKEHIGNNLELKDYKLWIADYTSASLNEEKPRVPPDFKWVMWQLTDKGTISNIGLNKGLDTNVLAHDDREATAQFK